MLFHRVLSISLQAGLGSTWVAHRLLQHIALRELTAGWEGRPKLLGHALRDSRRVAEGVRRSERVRQARTGHLTFRPILVWHESDK